MDAAQPPVAERRTRPDAPDRILRATVRCIVQAGAVALTMHDVAAEAGVSKGLIHYHFHDKDTLLARTVEWITRHLVARERSALSSSTPRGAVDDLWAWLSSELERGYVRVLIELGEWRNPLVRNAVRASAVARRDASAESLEQLFSLLGLRPRLPAALLADVVVAFIDGLAIATALDEERNPRAAFDVFWLSLLSLAE
ncbi:MAG TPA: TetR/AcrR family transcriptional regulator [Gemmatimonadaceae bacterium]|jgi:AcrR family transcriptional regulator|nr:TetR/AcrR family transcriptional regulator [Gemmatimonadaceae bacterium]